MDDLPPDPNVMQGVDNEPVEIPDQEQFATPGLEGIEKATGVDVANTIIRFVERHAKPGRTRTRGKG